MFSIFFKTKIKLNKIKKNCCPRPSTWYPQESRKLLVKEVVSPKLNSFNLDENARPVEFFKFIPFKSDTQQKILEGLSTIQSLLLMARLDRTSDGSNTKKVTLTCPATSYSLPNSSTQRFQRRICLQYAFSLFFFFLLKKKCVELKLPAKDACVI